MRGDTGGGGSKEGGNKSINYKEETLKEFLVEAKRNTYAGDGALSESSRPNSKDLHYGEGNLLYIDSYFGSADFIGQEVVLKKQVPIWGMNYYGRMLVADIPEGFIRCLKSALRAVPLEYPFRLSGWRLCQITYTCL